MDKFVIFSAISKDTTMPEQKLKRNSKEIYVARKRITEFASAAK